MPAPSNDTAKIISEIQASETRTAERIAQATAATAAKLDQQTQTLLGAIGGTGTPSDNSEVLAAIAASQTVILAAETASTQTILDALAAAPPDSGGGDTTPSPGNDTQPTFTAADGTVSGLVTAFGAGPDIIAVAIDSGPNATDPIVSFGLYQMTGPAGAPIKHIAAAIPVPLRSAGSQKPGGSFEFHVDYGGVAPFLYLTEETELRNCYVKGVTFNGFPYECPDTADKDHPGVSLTKWDNNGIPLHWNPQGTAQSGGGGGTPVPAPANELATFFSNVTPGQTVALPGRTILGSTDIAVGCTVQGAGIDVTIVDGVGSEPAGDKALFHTNTPDLVTFSDMTIQNAKNPASMGTANANAAAIKPELQTMSIMVRRVKFANNQNGLLCSGLDAEDCVFDDNGRGEPTKTHEIYVRGSLPMRLVRLTMLSTTDANHGHPVKSRSPDNYHEDVTAIVSLNGGGHDYPDCGRIEHKGGGIAMKAGAADHKLLSIGGESAKNKTAPDGNLLKLSDWHVDAAPVGGGIIQFNATNAADYIVQILPGCTYTGDTAPIIKGLTNPAAQVTGAFTKAG